MPLLAVTTARAQVEDGQIAVTPFVTRIDFGSELGLNGETGFGMSISGALTPNIALEGAVLRASGIGFELVDDKTTIYREVRFGGLFYFNRPHDKVLPYATVGVSYLELSRAAALDPEELQEEAEAAERETLLYSEEAAGYDNGVGWTWGLGTHYFLTERLALRFDLRWFSATAGTSFNNFEPFIGLTFLSGGR
jgi:opacity protein-like surface antigen